MSRLARLGATSVVLSLGVSLSLASLPAQAAKRRRPPPPPAEGWTVDSVRFEALDPALPIGVDGVGEYRGAIEVRRSGGGVNVVNQVELEDYVRGISEVPSSWPAEALKAQAIAARTYALHQITGKAAAAQRRAVGADICATDSCQVYAGLAKERGEGGGAWVAAVEATAGQVLLYRGAPILAKYSSSNGGRTVAGGQPYLRSVPDPDDARSPLSQWHSVVPLSSVRSILGIGQEIVTARRQGDSIVLVGPPPEVEGEQPAESAVPAVDFRVRLNGSLGAPAGLPSAVPSTQFDVTVDAESGTLALDGRGYGHGIGMSQFGALGKALRGQKAAQILGAYYGGLKPVTAPPELVPPSLGVAIAPGRGQARVASADGGRFRVLDGKGQVIVPVATGTWLVSGGPKSSVRVVPPAEQFAPVVVEPLTETLERSADAVPLKLRLSAPAVLRLTATPPGGPPQALEPEVVGAGESVRLLPVALVEGLYEIVMEVDAGPERSTTVPLTLQVGTPSPAGHGQASATAAAVGAGGPGTDPIRSPVTAAAFALLTVAATMVGRVHRRRGQPAGAVGAAAE